MKPEKFRYLAGVIAAHPERRVVGRTRLQKTIKLLQRVGLPTDYDFTIFFYGPYSEAVNADLRVLEHFGLVRETLHQGQEGPYYQIEAEAQADLAELVPFRDRIQLLSQTPAVVLELAATYDAFRTMGSDHAEALEALRRKKASKCTPRNVKAAFALLSKLGLPTDPSIR